MADPVSPPPVSGWQYVVLECVRTLVPVALALVAVWQSNRANDHAREATTTANDARVEAGKRPVFYGLPPKE